MSSRRRLVSSDTGRYRFGLSVRVTVLALIVRNRGGQG